MRDLIRLVAFMVTILAIIVITTIMVDRQKPKTLDLHEKEPVASSTSS
jgi:hypothetical protein